MMNMADIGFWEGIARDLSGAGKFRLFLQPLMAIFLGVRIGLADARGGKLPFFARLVHGHGQRWSILGHSLVRAWLPLALALLMDGIFQFLTLGRVRVLAAVVVGILLVWLPFSIARSVSNRISRRRHPPISQPT